MREGLPMPHDAIVYDAIARVRSYKRRYLLSTVDVSRVLFTLKDFNQFLKEIKFEYFFFLEIQTYTNMNCVSGSVLNILGLGVRIQKDFLRKHRENPVLNLFHL